jgi:predicted ABC-type ATPase
MQKKPEIIVFAGPNGSGKSTVTRLANIIEPYVNADDIKKSCQCSDLEAAQKADQLRNHYIDNHISFTFETVLSTDRNLKLLQRAKENGYFIRCIYVLTSDPDINVQRVISRQLMGGHGVPKEKILLRYGRALSLIPELVELCDVCHIYDNTQYPFRIFKKRKSEYFIWENTFWNNKKIEQLTGIHL